MITVKPVETEEQLADVHLIRRIVFVEEQHCPPEIEYEFEEESHHFIALMDGVPVGCARWRSTDYGYKLERFAVLKEFRGKGVGEAVLKSVIEHLPAEKRIIYLHAQISARDFYLKYNFHPVGENFWEADIEHVKMVLGEGVGGRGSGAGNRGLF